MEQVTDSKAGENAEKVHREKESVLGGRGEPRYRPRDEGRGSGVVNLDSGLTKPNSIPTQAGPEPLLSARKLIKQ